VSHSFIATANAIRYCGATPVFVDIEPGTFNIDPGLVEGAVSTRTKAVLCVHQLGMPCDLARIVEIGRRHSIPVVEDAACAIGSEIAWKGEWQRLGRPHGDIACFSFHPRKVLSTGDGGMITTGDAVLDREFRLLRQHGMSVADAERHDSAAVVFETYASLGFNYRMTDIQAAIGREQLARLPAIVARRRELAARYSSLLAEVPGIATPAEPAWARSNWQSYAIRLVGGQDQRVVMQRLLDEGISTRRAAMNAHREAAYPSGTWRCGVRHGACDCSGGSGCACLCRSEQAQDTAIVLPLFHEMTAEDQDRVVGMLRVAAAPS
jgi:dTDP-4-amino-4,6-dideoxygalactose transaminase